MINNRYIINIRLRQHLGTIKRFIPYEKIESEVADHFNRKGHNINMHFRFCIFEKDIVDTETRKSIETDLMHVFINMNAKILNTKIPSYFNIKKLCFSKN